MNRAALRAWTAAALPPVIWALLQQGWGQMVRQACGAARPGGLAAATGCLALLAISAFVAWPARRAEDTSRFVARVAIGEAIVFGLAVVFQLIAGLIVPPCWR